MDSIVPLDIGLSKLFFVECGAFHMPVTRLISLVGGATLLMKSPRQTRSQSARTRLSIESLHLRGAGPDRNPLSQWKIIEMKLKKSHSGGGGGFHGFHGRVGGIGHTLLQVGRSL